LSDLPNKYYRESVTVPILKELNYQVKKIAHKMVKFLKTIWEHKKKFIFLCGAGYYGLDFLYNRHQSFKMIRVLCQESLEQGKRPLPLVAKNKHITLLLNPVSANRKARWRFEKYAEPMLHLSGFLVNVVKTERISEARDLTELIERTNVIAVAGGDGTLFETITGLLRREDADDAARKFPIGIIPVGIRNKFAKSLFPKENATDPELIAESTMAIVRHKIKAHDVLRIEVMESNQNQEEKKPESGYIAGVDGELPDKITPDEIEIKEAPKPVYSVSGITVGQYREADHIQTNMPSIFSTSFATFWSLLRAPRPQFKAELRYTPACKGCTKCLKDDPTPQQSILTRMSSVLRPSRATNSDSKPRIENPDCGTWSSMCVDTLEFNVKPKGDGCLEVEVGVDNGRTEFIGEGMRRLDGQPPILSNTFECSQLEIIPLSTPEFCSIDYEEFEVKPMRISVLRDKVYFFAP